MQHTPSHTEPKNCSLLQNRNSALQNVPTDVLVLSDTHEGLAPITEEALDLFQATEECPKEISDLFLKLHVSARYVRYESAFMTPLKPRGAVVLDVQCGAGMGKMMERIFKRLSGVMVKAKEVKLSEKTKLVLQATMEKSKKGGKAGAVAGGEGGGGGGAGKKRRGMTVCAIVLGFYGWECWAPGGGESSLGWDILFAEFF